jgi:ADP-heptose:LPS heptosyltransferase
LPERELEGRAEPGFLAQVGQRRFDLVLQMHGSGRIVNPLVGLLGGRASAGYFVPGDYCPDPKRYLSWQAGEHEILRWLRLVEALVAGYPGLAPVGAGGRDAALEFPLHAADLAQYQALATAHALAPGSYVCLHPGSQLPSRRWLPERFAAVGDALCALGYRVALTGTGLEAGLTAHVAAAMQGTAIDLAGRTSLGAAAALIAHAAALVCNDTGVSHIAAAMGTPSVVISCGADPARWAPLDRQRHRYLCAPVPCRPCAHQTCPYTHACADAIGADVVVGALRSLLPSRPAAHFRARQRRATNRHRASTPGSWHQPGRQP